MLIGLCLGAWCCSFYCLCVIVGFGGLVLICCLCLLRGCCLNGCFCVAWLLGMLFALGGYVCDRWVSVCKFVAPFSVLLPLY